MEFITRLRLSLSLWTAWIMLLAGAAGFAFSWVQADTFKPERFGIGAVLIQADSGAVVTVRGCTRGGPADRAGVMPGDEFVELDGKDVQTWPLSDVLSYLVRDAPLPVRVTIRRRTEMLSMQIVRARFSDIGEQAGIRYEMSADSTNYRAVPLVEVPAAEIGDIIVLSGLRERNCSDVQSLGATSDYRFVYFWASWCGPCKTLIRRLTKEPAGTTSLRVLGVNVDTECENFVAAADSIDPPGEQYWAGGYHGYLPQVLRVYRRGIPTAVVLDSECRLVAIAVGIDEVLALYRSPNPK